MGKASKNKVLLPCGAIYFQMLLKPYWTRIFLFFFEKVRPDLFFKGRLFLFFDETSVQDNNEEKTSMKHSKSLVFVSSAIASVFLLLVTAYQPLSQVKATRLDGLADAVNFNSSFFDEAFTVDSPTSATDFCGNYAEANFKKLIARNKDRPFDAFSVYGQSGFTGMRMVQGCALGFAGWDMIYGKTTSSLPHPFRIQKISDDELTFVPFGFFMGVHGIRKIAFQGYSMVMPISNESGVQSGKKNLAVYLADLDGTNKYNLTLDNTAPTEYIEVEVTAGVWKYTFTLPEDEAKDWTPRWIYVAGAFSPITLSKVFSTATSDVDKKTYFNDLYSVEVWFDATC